VGFFEIMGWAALFSGIFTAPLVGGGFREASDEFGFFVDLKDEALRRVTAAEPLFTAGLSVPMNAGLAGFGLSSF
jgi:hypothetical protein